MFVKILPYYHLCASCCMGFLRSASSSCENGSQQQSNNGYANGCDNNNLPEHHVGGSKVIVTNVAGIDHNSNGATNHDRTRDVKSNAFEKVIRNPPEFVRICCWCFVNRRNDSSPEISPSHQRNHSIPPFDENGMTNVVVPIDGGTIYTPMKNFIGREVGDDSSCHVFELEEDTAVERLNDLARRTESEQQQQQPQQQSPRSSGGTCTSGDTDTERVANCSTASTTVEVEELIDENNEENNNKQQVSSHAQQQRLDLLDQQRPNLSPSKHYGNGGHNQNSSSSSNQNNNPGRFFGAETTIDTPHRTRFLGEDSNSTSGEKNGGGINQESYIIHRDEQYDSEEDEKSSNDSTSTRIISNSTFNFGNKGSDPYPPPTPNISSHPTSILSSRPQSVTSHKSIGSGILKSEGRISRTSNISYSNISLKQQSGDNASAKSARSVRSREEEAWYDREGTPVRSEDVISSNQVNYESDYDDDVEDEPQAQQQQQQLKPRTATPKRYPTPSPHPLQISYSTEELTNVNYNQVEDTEIPPPSKSRIQSASLGNLQQLPDDDDYEEPPQAIAPQPVKKILKKPYLVRKSSKVAPVKEVVSSVKAKNKMNEVIFQKTLRKFDKPKDALSNCITHLESPNWEQNISGLQFFVRLIRHHPEVIDTQIHLLSVALARQVRNLRSQVARAACQASSEFFSTHRRCIEGEAEDIATHLLHRTADTNKFLRADANQALESMCENLSNPKVIHIVSFKGATHQNAVVRTTAAKLLDKIVHQIGPDKAFALPKESRDKLVLTGAQLLLEGSLDTRNYAKSMFKQLSEHPNYNKVLLDVIPPRTYRNIEKSLNSIKQM